MKYETKISTISIVCALYATVSMPAFSAPVVRSLGGVGTYNGTSSAASGDVAAVRGGALRVNNTASSANKKSTGVKSGSRAAAAPRLSIGKYLGGSTTVKNNGLGNGGMDNSLSGGGNGNLQQRIEALETFMGYVANGDTIPEQMEDLRVDVDQLAEDLKKLSSGEVVDVTYADGVLTVVKAQGEPIKYPLSDLTEGLATKSAVGALETALDDLQKRMPAIGENLVTEQQLEDLKTVLEQAIDAKQDSGDYAQVSELESLAKQVEVLQSGAASGADIEELRKKVEAELAKKADVDSLAEVAISGSYDDLKNKPVIPSVEGLATEQQLEDLKTVLEQAIDAKQDSGDYAAVADLKVLAQQVESLQSGSASGADVEELRKKVEAILADYAKKSEVDVELAKKADVDSLAEVATSGSYDDLKNKPVIPSVEGLATEQQLEDLKTVLEQAIDAKQDSGDYAEAAELESLAQQVESLQSGSASGADVVALQKQVNDIVVDYASKKDLSDLEADVLAKIAALDLTVYAKAADVAGEFKRVDAELAKKANTADLANVAISGSYDDLTDKPVIPSVEGFLTADDLSDLEDAVDALEQVDVAMDTAIKALQGGMITEETLNAKAAELAAADKALQDAIEALQDDMPSTEGLVNQAYVDGLVADLQLADTALQNAIEAIEKPDVNKKYVDEAIASLNTAISGLQGADSAMEQTIAGLEAALANAATKEDIKDFITGNAVDAKIQSAVSGLATAEDIKDFVTSGDMQAEIAKLATKSDIASFVNSGQVTEAIAEATKDLATKAELVDFVKSGDLASTIATEITKADLATKTELANAKSELQAAIDKLNAGDVELTNYYTQAEVDAKVEGLQGAIDAKQDKLTAGTNITISNNVISASVDTSGFVPNPGTTPTEYGEYVLMLSIGEDGKPEGYDWLDTLDLMGDTGFEM